MKRPPTILFDLGGVLIENVTFAALNALLSERLEEQALRERWLASTSVRAFELGHIDPGTFATRFIEEWHAELSPDEFLAEFITWPRAFCPGALELVAQLRARHEVACLSNCNELHWAKFDGFAGQFDTAFSSHLLGRIKPDIGIFRAALDMLAVDAPDAYYFDDSAACVEAARGLGMLAYHVDGPENCRRILEAAGLLDALRA